MSSKLATSFGWMLAMRRISAASSRDTPPNLTSPRLCGGQRVDRHRYHHAIVILGRCSFDFGKRGANSSARIV